MSADPNNRISDLYHRARQRPPGERHAFLRQACEGDDAVRLEVESLLQYESVSAGFLERPAAAWVTHGMTGQIGPYRILDQIGVGGMGEVYRAHDTKLGRDVAIKILPLEFLADPERRTRFAREARLLATLNHPHIGSIYGLEEGEGVTALVLEFVEGPTLADRLERGPLSVAQTIVIARQVASALDEAHEKGIIHRDLKPANIVLQGASVGGFGEIRAKVLDFGLAKTLELSPKEGAEAQLASAGGTADGRILGTPAYMSPEQARGLAVDKRTDVWAFGCVLFEMLSGRRPFEGDTVTDTFARILEREPEWGLLPVDTPPHVRSLIERCLRKDPRKRLHDIADALIEIDGNGTRVESTRSGWLSGWQAGWIAAAALTLAWGAVTVFTHLRQHVPPPEPVEFAIAPPEGSIFSRYPVFPEFAISPDGRHVAFVAPSKYGSSLWLRSLAEIDVHELPGTQGARNPFWKPDSQAIGFFADDKLKWVPLAGGTPTIVCAAVGTGNPVAPSGTWNDADIIVFTPAEGGSGALWQVDLKRRLPTRIAIKDESPLLPSFLPDGNHFLYLAPISPKPGEPHTSGELHVASLTSESTVIGPAESDAIYAAGHLFFVRGGTLTAQSYDVETRKLTGKPLDLNMHQGLVMFHRTFSVALSGRLVYSPPPVPAQLTWVDRQGTTLGTVGDPGYFINLDLGRNDSQVAVAGGPPPKPGERLVRDIWVIDVATGRRTRLTDDPAMAFDPTWSPDGNYIAFNSCRPTVTSPFGLFMRAWDSTGDDIELVKGTVDTAITSPDWSRTNVLVYNKGSLNQGNVGTTIWTLPMSGGRMPTPFLNTRFDQQGGSISPNGRLIGYVSDESGRHEVYVRSFPDKGPAHQLSRNGGEALRWRGDGKELFFVSPDSSMMSAKIDPNTGEPTGNPVPLFATQFHGGNHPYAVSRDGKRFLIPIWGAQQLTVVMDWRTMTGR
jgi:Tol biopolymer transport system component